MKRLTLVLVMLAASVAFAVSALAARATITPVQQVALSIKSDTEHARKGPDGKWHDAYLPAAFTVHAGSTVKVTIANYDPAVHTFTSSRLGLDVKVAPGSASRPHLTTFTFTAPRRGSYTWVCLGQCDNWAMTHRGYMTGVVRVV